MRLIDKVKLFYKLAAEKGLTEEGYKNRIAGLQAYDLQDIDTLINTYESYPFFKLDDFLPRIYEIIKDSLFMEAGIDFIENNMVNAPKIIHYVLKRFVDDPNVDMQVNDNYFIYEMQWAPADLLRKAQNKIIKAIIERYKKNEDYIGAKSELITELQNLLENSNAFSDSFILNLAKHIDLDVYTGLKNRTTSSRDYENELMSIMNKPKINLFDVAEIFAYHENRGYDFRKEDFLRMIENADDRAKEYMRGFIYYGPPTFILNSDMTPLTIDYKTVAWPEHLTPKKLNTFSGDARIAWFNILADFNVVPQ